ncbi:hypothetical protein PDIP_26330 [Penicillium digitatum Pd1]|uniref:Uncharacterized protein n=1 Tax=Penicillium digitatum (strain Pd1 / CECT 20795) TaxID=1170230 RepID=K9GBY9_PEND1|nr:hypothetical protein PDIP_26330 [Penicillium digitatum Pd1]EKV18687.1 hypothetical protein PDIP_26330 [Penicillium digitatum Pd1]
MKWRVALVGLWRHNGRIPVPHFDVGRRGTLVESHTACFPAGCQ